MIRLRNVPDDWGNYYSYCSTCNTRWHASEGGCNCIECEMCQEYKSPNDFDETIDDCICIECMKCNSCGELNGGKNLKYDDEGNIFIYCKNCAEEYKETGNNIKLV